MISKWANRFEDKNYHVFFQTFPNFPLTQLISHFDKKFHSTFSIQNDFQNCLMDLSAKIYQCAASFQNKSVFKRLILLPFRKQFLKALLVLKK